jgi:hypothetical protein
LRKDPGDGGYAGYNGETFNRYRGVRGAKHLVRQFTDRNAGFACRLRSRAAQ